MESNVRETRYRVEGMDCASCAAKIDTAVRRVAGVEDVKISAAMGTMTVRHTGAVGPVIIRKVGGLGYGLSPMDGLTQSELPHADDHDCCGHAHEHAGCAHRHGHEHPKGGASAFLNGVSVKSSAGPRGHAADRWWRTGKGRLAVACGIALAVAYAAGKFVPASGPWVFTLAMLVGLLPIARRAVMAAFAGTPFSIEMLMTIAALGAVVIGAGEEAAMVVFLFLIGELLEGVAASKARASIEALTALVPKSALMETDGATREVPAESLPVGAIILVRPGDRVSADGVIVAGESSIDEAPVTGESTPVSKETGDSVFAGTVNGAGALRIRVTAASADNTIARVVKLVEAAQESKAPTERFIDRFSRYYTPAVVLVSVLVAIVPPLFWDGIWQDWIYKGLALLLIGCPCALVISTPAAIAASLSEAARRGLLIKGGAVLEDLGRITAAAFDKTGTLTQGKPVMTDVVGFDMAEAEVVRHAAALEQGSGHPLAGAVLSRAESDGLTLPRVEDAKAIGGKGISGSVAGAALFLGSSQAADQRVPLTAGQKELIAALHDQGKTVSVLLADGRAAGILAMRDEPRADAAKGVKALTNLGIRVVMLTGDNRRTAETIGGRLGIEVRSELLPEDKQRIIRELQAEGFAVAKIGDGINDAPALAAADVGIAMGGGTDVALETADAASLHARVSDIAAMVGLSRATMRNIYQNIGMALGLKAVFLATTVAGVTGLWPAILADTGATVLVTANALRLLRPIDRV
ncbi:heavy metal translocating P-type ATPase [Sinorhizobium numidicum]|uniref:P-type Zn(2+) transporter n=1 Tax=Sinorhizobium numidicum TaxID=680248 RepID=A0ABY8D3Q9_9HYPH|nr:heavy metal translocating P-type ATPase [Sinorhizobium numidicum]WEX77515.1 heavy metal translocating P-type ATPase [Sinorhizobium numidicum]WEX84175.1 heavy metal translocating P-type ATPase [Sinorhizobium numidicum]